LRNIDLKYLGKEQVDEGELLYIFQAVSNGRRSRWDEAGREIVDGGYCGVVSAGVVREWTPKVSEGVVNNIRKMGVFDRIKGDVHNELRTLPVPAFRNLSRKRRRKILVHELTPLG